MHDPVIGRGLWAGKRLSTLPETYLRLQLTAELPRWLHAAINVELQRRAAKRQQEQSPPDGQSRRA
jgi:hypothetical protein